MVVSQSKLLPENFFEGGSNFIEDGSFGQFILNLHRHLTENDFSLKGGGVECTT